MNKATIWSAVTRQPLLSEKQLTKDKSADKSAHSKIEMLSAWRRK